MNANPMAIGTLCICQVGVRKVKVELLAEEPQGGWRVKTVSTGKTMTVRDTRRLTAIATQADELSPVQNEGDTVETVATRAKPLSLLNAAAMVLEACDRPLSCKEIIDKAVDAGIWQPKAGKTPANTLSAAIRREIKNKTDTSRFQLAERGKFVRAGQR